MVPIKTLVFNINLYHPEEVKEVMLNHNTDHVMVEHVVQQIATNKCHLYIRVCLLLLI